MARLKPVRRRGDLPGTPDAATEAALDALFERMFPGRPDAEISGDHLALGVLARDPRLASLVLGISGYLAREAPWFSKNFALRELAIQSLNLHFRCDYSFQSHIAHWKAAGLRPEQLALLPFWRTANAFDDEQRLVIEYTLAVASGDVSDELFARVVALCGEQGALELTAGVAWWSFWAMIINAVGVEFDFGHGKPDA